MNSGRRQDACLDASARPGSSSPRTFSGKSVHYLLLCLILGGSAYLIFKNCGDASLWVDEAATAIIARNFLKTGHFTGWDGRNLYALKNGSGLKTDLTDPNPPMQFLLTAAAFYLFGESNFSARFFMALFGLCTVIALYWYLRTEFPDSPAIALYGAAFLGMFPEFILYMRNCRYYAVTAFAALLTFFAFRCFCKRPDVKSAAGLGVAAIVLYFSNFLICAALLVPLALALLLFEQRGFLKKQRSLLLPTALMFLAVTAPYTLFSDVWNRPDIPGIPLPDRIRDIWYYLKDGLRTGTAPWAILAATAGLIIFCQYDVKSKHIAKSVLFIILVHILFIGFTSLQNTPEKYSIANIRYLVACFPLTAILAALILYRIHKLHGIAAFIVLLLLIGSNISYALPGVEQTYKFRHPAVYSPLYEYVKEIHHPYPTATGAVAAYLSDNARRDETYYSLPEYTDDPLKFYLGGKLINSCVLNRDTYLGAQRMKSLSPYLLIEENFPDWLIYFGKLKIKNEQNSIGYFSRTFYGQETPDVPVSHDYALVKIFDTYWGQTNRPEILLHNFGPVRRIIPNESVVLIYRKVHDVPSEWLLHFPRILLGAQVWNERGICLKTLRKFYGLYLKDSAQVLKTYPQSEVLDFFTLYGQLLLENGQSAEADRVQATISLLQMHERGK